MDLVLRQYFELQQYQKEKVEQNQTTEAILNNSKTVSLDQLMKHKKDLEGSEGDA